ncbi:MAG: potassium channel protein [Anaerolineae bacterium]|nr:potassium channel protein [Anaerolineae bacterium]
MRTLRQRLITFLAMLTFVIGMGTLYYRLVEGWSWVDSLFMTVITLTTVGYGEVQPLDPAGRLFTVVLILLGVSAVAIGFGSLGEYVLASGLLERIRERGMMQTINKLENHVIVCGAGRVGRTAVEALRDMNRPCVIVDSNCELVEEIQDGGGVALCGDATRDETLLKAGLQRASGLIVSTGSDSDNLFIVLSARTLNPDIFIVSRSIDASSEAKMRRVGADKVVSPYQIGGRHMANVVLRPHVTEFLDVVTLDSGLELWLEEVYVDASSPLAGRTVVESDLRRETGVTLVAVMDAEKGEMLTPDEKMRIKPGDELIVLGTMEQLERLTRLSGSRLGHHSRRPGAPAATGGSSEH